MQVCLHSGPMVAYALGMDEDDDGPKALRILPIATHTSHEAGYMAAAVVVNAPADANAAKRLNEAVKLPNSTLYQNPGQLVRGLAAQIDANECIIHGELSICPKQYHWGRLTAAFSATR